ASFPATCCWHFQSNERHLIRSLEVRRIGVTLLSDMRYQVLSLLLLLSFSSELRAQTPVTFNNQIVRIFEQHCQTCHRPGNIAPFSLLTYQDAVVRTRLIRDQVESRQMPPWKPVGSHGIFKGERALTDQE